MRHRRGYTATIGKRACPQNCFFQGECGGRGECLLLERVENRKLLPLPMLKVKFQVSRNLRFSDEGDGAVTDKYYRNDILSLGPRQRVTRKIPLPLRSQGLLPYPGAGSGGCGSVPDKGR